MITPPQVSIAASSTGPISSSSYKHILPSLHHPAMLLVDESSLIRCYCSSRSSRSYAALNRHKRALTDMHHLCKRCDDESRPDFASRKALEEHWAEDHGYCKPCKRLIKAGDEARVEHRPEEHEDV